MQLSGVREVAAGRWRGILVALGVDDRYLTGKHGPCPACGGTDRFRWDDKGGNGSSYCSQCGATDGVGLVMKVKGYDFRTAALEIERAAGFVKPEKHRPAATDDDKVKALRRLWKESKPVVSGDEVSRYLSGRGLPVPQCQSLRLHEDLAYREGGNEVGRYKAMLALVTAPGGSGASIHRTYLLDGGKAPVTKPKKLMPGLPISGAAVRLFPVGETLGIAEGIETALSAFNRFGIPTWAAVSAGGLESWVCPDETKKVVIFGDNDKNFTGQRAAYALASRLSMSGIEVNVRIPDVAGRDWADV